MAKCPKCGSENVSIQVVNESQLLKKHHSIIWWICIGCWFVPLMWCVFFIPKILIKLLGLGHIKYKIKNVTKKKAVCQSCSNVFDLN